MFGFDKRAKKAAETLANTGTCTFKSGGPIQVGTTVTKAIDDHVLREQEEKERKAKERKEKRQLVTKENLIREANRAIAFKRFNAALNIMSRSSATPAEALRRVDTLLDRCGINQEFYVNTSSVTVD